MKTCLKLCDECPFSKTSSRGFLADYTVKDFILFQRNDVLFPCHKLTSVDMTVDQAKKLILDDKLLVCRGYVESMQKSCKIPRDPGFATLIKNVELSENSMSIFEFIIHHSDIDEES